MAGTRTYGICGITVRSDWDLPYCEPGEAGQPLIDLVACSPDDLQAAAAGSVAVPGLPAWYQIRHLQDGSTLLQFPELFDILVSAGGRLIGAHRRTDEFTEAFYTY